MYYDKNYEPEIQELRRSFNYDDFLMQLVHLYEIVVRMLFIYLVNNNLIKKKGANVKSYSLTFKGVANFVERLGLNKACLSVLCNFRNSYVHLGHLSAEQYLYSLLCDTNRYYLMNIATFAQVYLDFSRLSDFEELIRKANEMYNIIAIKN